LQIDMTADQTANREEIPTTLMHTSAPRFWAAIVVTGVGSGLSTALLTSLLFAVQHFVWQSSSNDLVSAAASAPAWQHVLVLMVAALLTAGAQLVMVRLSTGNGIEIATAIWFFAGRLPVLRTLISAVVSVFIVAMGVSLGREGAPKQVGAVIANLLSDRMCFSDEQRRLLVACGAGAGIAAAYDVPLGGALFALEVLRGIFALRLVLPALAASLIATVVSWIAIPGAATYTIPLFRVSASMLLWALLVGPIAGIVSVGYVRAIAFADRHRPAGEARFVAPILVFALLALASIPFPEVLGNGKDVTQLLFEGQLSLRLVLVLLLLKPLFTICSLGSGAPGGLFTPSLALGALLGSAAGDVWSMLSPGVPLGFFAVVGAGAVLAVTTQGPISAAVLMIELTGRDRAFLAPLLVAIVTATLVARTLDLRSIYDARLSDEELAKRQLARQTSAR
jgi:CIC family chloride channel protein